MYLSDNHNSIEKNLVIILLLNLKVSFQHKFVDQLYCRTWNEISTSQNKQKKRKFFFYNFVTGILQEVRKKATSTRFVDFGKELPIWYFGGSFPHSLFFSAADEKKQDTLVKSLTVRKENKQKLKLSRKFFPKHQNNIKEQKTNLQEKNLRQCWCESKLLLHQKLFPI